MPPSVLFADPPPEERAWLVDSLMDVRRTVGAAKQSGDEVAETKARRDVDAAKQRLSERKPGLVARLCTRFRPPRGTLHLLCGLVRRVD